MVYVVAIIAIWVVVAFIRSKIKSESFLESLIEVPISIIGFFLDEASTHRSDYSKVESRARKEGRDDVLEKIEKSKKGEAEIRRAAKDMKEKLDEKRK